MVCLRPSRDWKVAPLVSKGGIRPWGDVGEVKRRSIQKVPGATPGRPTGGVFVAIVEFYRDFWDRVSDCEPR